MTLKKFLVDGINSFTVLAIFFPKRYYQNHLKILKRIYRIQKNRK